MQKPRVLARGFLFSAQVSDQLVPHTGGGDLGD